MWNCLHEEKPVNYYRLKDVTGCVVDEIRAVQVTSHDPFYVDQIDEIQDVFPEILDDNISVEVEAGVICIRDSKTRMIVVRVHWSDYLFEDPDGSEIYHVLDKRNFEDTYVKVEH